MTLSELKRVVDEACVYAGDRADTSRVEVWLGKKGPYDVLSVGQFGVVPDIAITAGVLHKGREQEARSP